MSRSTTINIDFKTQEERNAKIEQMFKDHVLNTSLASVNRGGKNKKENVSFTIKFNNLNHEKIDEDRYSSSESNDSWNDPAEERIKRKVDRKFKFLRHPQHEQLLREKAEKRCRLLMALEIEKARLPPQEDPNSQILYIKMSDMAKYFR
uniref:Uncharacterized protein n=1 Tax=Rhabditophanes sp. KR3021 TaxID=114890 RepID=A0AC35TKP9_9BILA